MKIKTYKVYKFDELSDGAKEKALNEFRNDSFFGEYPWEQTQEDAKDIGLKLHGTDRGSMSGDFIGTALECAEKIIKEHGKKCETYKTARKYLRRLKLKTDEKREAAEHEFLHDILKDYRIMSEKDQEYAYSDEAIKEAIKANEYDFLETGKLD